VRKLSKPTLSQHIPERIEKQNTTGIFNAVA
jgi:hypothetical protein